MRERKPIPHVDECLECECAQSGPDLPRSERWVELHPAIDSAGDPAWVCEDCLGDLNDSTWTDCARCHEWVKRVDSSKGPWGERLCESCLGAVEAAADFAMDSARERMLLRQRYECD